MRLRTSPSILDSESHSPLHASHYRPRSARVALRVLLTLAAITVLPRPAYSDILYTWVNINGYPYTGSMVVAGSALDAGGFTADQLLSINFQYNGQTIFNIGPDDPGLIVINNTEIDINSSGVQDYQGSWYGLDSDNNFIGSSTADTWITYTTGFGGYQVGLTIEEDNGMGVNYQLTGCMEIDTNYTPPQAVPEPSSLALAGCGAACWLAYGWTSNRRRRRLEKLAGTSRVPEE